MSSAATSSPSPRPPVRPRDAASLILYRSNGRSFEVLMGRRPAGARFMPSVYVFPGGAVETSDARVSTASALPEHIPEMLRVGSNRQRARAMAVSAIRETQEETGLIVGEPGDVGCGHGVSWRPWQQRGLAPNLGCLDLLGRAITPPTRPIRFHARFFLAHAKHVTGDIGGDGELEDIGWISIDDAATLKLADIQRFLLAHLDKVLIEGGPSGARPLFTHRQGRRLVRWR